jgi:glycosyltransferase involved in cell wall biosynthesis
MKNPLRKMVRILVYPNITYQKDLEKDSYIQVIKKQISLLNEIRDDLWFYLILPKEVESLSFPNTTQLIYPLPTYPPTMRSHFNVGRFKKLIPHSLDIDLVFSHLPEHTHAIKNTLYNLTHHTPNFFGYCHWFDLKEVVAWHADSFLQNITGVLECEKVYLNTEHQKQLVLKQASEHFNEKTISELDGILTVHHLGVDGNDVVKRINANPDRTIVFNHRPDTYKNYNGFIKTMDALWKQRQDFNVWVPLLKGKLNRPYLNNDSGDKDFYYERLKSCLVGFSPKQKYGGWSVATTDGMMNGVPYIMFDDTYYHELYSDADFFKSDQEALGLLNKYLDDKTYRNKRARDYLRHTKKNLIYKDTVQTMSGYIDQLVLSLPKTVSSHLNEDEDVLADLYRLIRNAGKRKRPQGITKDALFKSRGGWGRGMKWTPYRQRLLSHGAIYDVVGETPTYWFHNDEDDSYKESEEYKQWVELIKRQDKRDKKVMSKLRNKRLG